MKNLKSGLLFVLCIFFVCSSTSLAWEVGGSIYTVMLNKVDNKYIIYEACILDIQGDVVKVQNVNRDGTLGGIGYKKLPLGPYCFPTLEQAHESIQTLYRHEYKRNKGN